MATTYEPIQTYTANGGSNSINFTSIPSTYTDLILVIKFSTASSAGVTMQFNSDTATNYSKTSVYAATNGVASFRQTNQSVINVINGATNVNMAVLQIQNYSNTTTYKSGLIRRTEPVTLSDATIFLWRSTAAINRIDISNNSSVVFSSGSVFTLYGIKAA